MRVSALFAGGLLLLMGTGAVSAATLVETGSLARIDVPAGTGGLSTSISVNKFDVSNATLTGIEVVFLGETYGSVTLTRTNTGLNGNRDFGNIGLRQDFTLTIAPSVTVTLNDVATNTTTLTVPQSASRVAATETPRNAALTPGSATSGTVSIASSLFSLFTGPGSISLALTILRDNFAASALQGNSGTWSATHDNEAVAQLQVTYIYTQSQPPSPVPAPMALALFGIGLLGLGAIRHLRG
jgi:hypothetical protein